MASSGRTTPALVALLVAVAAAVGCLAFVVPRASGQQAPAPLIAAPGRFLASAGEAPQAAGGLGTAARLAGLGLAAVGFAAILAKPRCAAAGTAAQQPGVVALRAGPKVLEGTGGPNPNDFWDPAGLTVGKSDDQLLYWRAVELKHGRICMLACLHWFHVAAGWHPIVDAENQSRVTNDPMVNVTMLPMGGMWQTIFTIMCLEWLTTYICKPPANKPWDVLGWDSIIGDDEEPEWKEVQLRELNNGRLAMFGILGLIGQDLSTGNYFAGIAQPCFGACPDVSDWTFVPFPAAPLITDLINSGPGM